MVSMLLGIALLLPALGADMTTLTISVKNTAGKPVDGASVVVKFVKGRSKAKFGAKIRKEWEMHTNPEGVVTLPPLPKGTITVQVIAKNYQTFGEEIDVDEDAKTIDVKLNPPQAQYTAQ